jgi:hypothetical protein
MVSTPPSLLPPSSHYSIIADAHRQTYNPLQNLERIAND